MFPLWFFFQRVTTMTIVQREISFLLCTNRLSSFIVSISLHSFMFLDCNFCVVFVVFCRCCRSLCWAWIRGTKHDNPFSVIRSRRRRRRSFLSSLLLYLIYVLLEIDKTTLHCSLLQTRNLTMTIAKIWTQCGIPLPHSQNLSFPPDQFSLVARFETTENYKLFSFPLHQTIIYSNTQ
jgi:hypothetical protein